MLVAAVKQSESAICIHMSPYPLPLEPPSHPPYPTPLGGHKAPSWSPCAMWLLPTSYLFYIWCFLSYVYILLILGQPLFNIYRCHYPNPMPFSHCSPNLSQVICITDQQSLSGRYSPVICVYPPHMLLASSQHSIIVQHNSHLLTCRVFFFFSAPHSVLLL